MNCCHRPSASGNSDIGSTTSPRGDSFDCCTERYEIVVYSIIKFLDYVTNFRNFRSEFARIHKFTPFARLRPTDSLMCEGLKDEVSLCSETCFFKTKKPSCFYAPF